MEEARRQFLRTAVAGLITFGVSNKPSQAVQPPETPKSDPEAKRSELIQGLTPVPSKEDVIKSWANSKNGILRSIASYNDPFTKAFNEKNPADKPLTFEGVNSAFDSQFNESVNKLIKINHMLPKFDQSNPHFAYLSKPVQWNSKEATRQLFRFMPRSLKSVQEDIKKIAKNDFLLEAGENLSRSDRDIALKELQSIKSPYWDVRSPYSDADLTLGEDGALQKLEYNLGVAQEPQKSQPRTIVFKSENDTTDNPPHNPEEQVYLVSGEYEDIEK
jgi:hypothetical protein